MARRRPLLPVSQVALLAVTRLGGRPPISASFLCASGAHVPYTGSEASRGSESSGALPSTHRREADGCRCPRQGKDGHIGSMRFSAASRPTIDAPTSVDASSNTSSRHPLG